MVSSIANQGNWYGLIPSLNGSYILIYCPALPFTATNIAQLYPSLLQKVRKQRILAQENTGMR